MARKTVIQLEGVAWVPGPIEYRTMVFMKAAGNELARTLLQSHLSENMPCKDNTTLPRISGYYVVLPIVALGNDPKSISI